MLVKFAGIFTEITKGRFLEEHPRQREFFIYFKTIKLKIVSG
jgi:hypothetical protein